WKMKTRVFLLLLVAFSCELARAEEENEAEELQVETLVQPESCAMISEIGDTLKIHYTGKLMDGKVIDTSLSRDPHSLELGARQVIPGKLTSNNSILQRLLFAQKIKAIIPSHLAYGKRGFPPTVPGDAALQFEVEVITLSRKTPFEKMIRSLLPTMCLALLPGLLCLIGVYIYKRGSAERPEKKKAKDKKSKKK
uniref:peptidylprolyl isomerase n=1 Tax=Nothobranchius furzeri TaxID=105023 RepID=A0A8C6LN98_NOTFU